MKHKLEGVMRGTRWDEHSFAESDVGPKLARAEVDNNYEGALSASGRLEYLLFYDPNGNISFEGYERITGAIGSKAGSFVVRHEGAFDTASGVAGRLRILKGSGTGDFTTISGDGSIRSNLGEHQGIYSLTCDLDNEGAS